MTISPIHTKRHFPELDRMVLQEIECFNRWNDQSLRGKPEDREKKSGKETIEPERIQRPKTGIPYSKHSAAGAFKPRKRYRQSPAPKRAGSCRPEIELDLDPTDSIPFDEEEASFIQNAIEWLSPRDNKDMIWSRVWEEIRNRRPEAFFSYGNSGEPVDTELNDGFDPHKPESPDLEGDNST